jgi:hypothetical protein
MAALASPVAAAELTKTAPALTKVPRSIGKEPIYRTKEPRYCLLVFGPEAKYRVWLVLDGDTLYVDRNGDGNLTEPGKSTKRDSPESEVVTFKPTTIFRQDGKTEEKFKFVLYGWNDYKAGRYTAKVNPAVHVNWKGRTFGSWGDETGSCQWGTKPQNAPVLLIDGPLQMGFEVPAELALESNGNGVYNLSVGVGTRGYGKGAFVHLCYTHNAIPENVHPTAVLEFPNKTAGGPPIRVLKKLQERC